MNRLNAILLLLLMCMPMFAASVIRVSLGNGTAEQSLAEALVKARKYNGKAVTILLEPAIYRIPREEAIVRDYYVSNTTSEQENPNPQKHIALLLRGMQNVTLDGQGSTLLLDGEMTTLVIDSCRNVVLRNLKIDNAHPTQVEMTVEENGPDYLKCCVHPTSQYRINNGKLEWYGKGWSWSYGIAQMYDPVRDITWRSWSPMQDLVETKELSPGHLLLKYTKKPDVAVQTVFQIRDSYRDEVCTLITESKNIRLEGIDFYYLGNFGVVSQVSENIAVHRCRFAPEQGSGRTNAGFADFLQFSGCKGRITVEDSYFCGAHDDPINVHGTHLQIASIQDSRHILLRYMHSQTYGFQSFFKGDNIDIVNPNTLLAASSNRVETARMLSPREIEITLTHPLDKAIISSPSTWVVENTTWTPQVRIARNYFCRIPTRGILVTTRRKVVIEDNTFCGMHMSGILVADDGRSWFESGPVHNLLIRGNTFLQCGSPVVLIAPENAGNPQPVHRNIAIQSNIFRMATPTSIAISAHAVDGLTIQGNLIEYPSGNTPQKPIDYSNCTHVLTKDNKVE